MALARIQRNIVESLQKQGRLSNDQVDALLNSEEDLSVEQLDKRLYEDFKLTEFQVLVAKGEAFNLKPFLARNYTVNDRTFAKLEKDFCQENKILPIGHLGGHILIALSDPFNISVSGRVQEITGLKVTPLLALERELDVHLVEKDEGPKNVGFGDVVEEFGEEFAGEEHAEGEEDRLEEDSAPIIRLANRIIEEAYYSGGSDIHIEPFEKHARVRVRVDGVCNEKLSIPSKIAMGLLARLKVMANLDIAEKRLPQDGRIIYKQFNNKGIDIDLRLATAPLNHGEGCVMRILDKQKSTLPLSALGYSEENLELYRSLITRPYGMILHCGPTGSGKSMTLYSALNEINEPDICIRTAEDPIEYTLPGLCQMQMNRKIGLTFASALRAYLRQDPDIILVGEIRDKETAQIAVEAALTGHLLFSTLHTNDAPSTISRLTEMDIERFMISASLLCICAQRLMRRVCKTCKQSYEPEGRELELLQRGIHWTGSIKSANTSGCPTCGGNGYKGRVGTHELMAVSEDLVKGINAGYETARLKKIAIRNGMKTLHQDSLLKVKDGITTIQEALATIPPDLEDLDKIINSETLELALAE